MKISRRLQFLRSTSNNFSPSCYKILAACRYLGGMQFNDDLTDTRGEKEGNKFFALFDFTKDLVVFHESDLCLSMYSIIMTSLLRRNRISSPKCSLSRLASAQQPNGSSRTIPKCKTISREHYARIIDDLASALSPNLMVCVGCERGINETRFNKDGWLCHPSFQLCPSCSRSQWTTHRANLSWNSLQLPTSHKLTLSRRDIKTLV